MIITFTLTNRGCNDWYKLENTHTLQISATLYLYTELFSFIFLAENEELLLLEVIVIQKSHISSTVYHFSKIGIPLFTVVSNPTVCHAEAKKKIL